MAKKMVTIDGNTAAAHVAYAFSDVAAIYPITPSSPMGENSEIWASQGLKNMEGQTVDVIEMQSEAGAAGSVHGSLVAGAQTTTFTASQGLLLMIPNMYKIAGEMLPSVFHVSARSLACQALSIFGDHSDVMSVRQTGFAMVAANSIQETQDLALVSHLATLEAEVPFLNFFDGFRTSHEIQKVEEISYEDMKSLVKPEYVERFRKRAMRPEAPVCRVAAQNPDVYFQGRETTNKHYEAIPSIVQKYMDQVGELTGRKYKLFDYVGAADAETVVIAMGSGCDTIEPTVDYLNSKGAKYGLLKVRLFRPFSADAFVDALPSTCKTIVALDRTKEPGSLGEPLFQDIVTVLSQKGSDIKVIGGRYGLSSKEFTPGMIKGIFDHATGENPFHGFTVGIEDDVTNLSIPYSEDFDIMPADVKSCMFWGLGADGTVGAAKNSVKIIGGNTDKNAQAYFVYDSKKSGGVTVSHLRFGDSSCNYPFLITAADFVSCSNPAYIGRYDMLSALKEGATFLLNSEIPTSEVFSHLTKEEQQIIIDRKINFYNIDALKISTENGLGHRTNTVMQTVFFKLAGILPEEQAIDELKKAIKKTFAKKGDDIVQMNWKCVDAARDAVEKVEVPASVTSDAYVAPQLLQEDASEFAKDVMLPVMLQKGDNVPVSKMTFDGVIPTGTTKVEKRGVAPRVPKWISENCIQCNQCVQACPHAVVRAKQIEPASLENAPEGFTTLKSKTKNEKDLEYKLQVYIEDCTGCGVCIETCPAKTKALEFSTLETEREAGERTNAEFFEALPNNILDGAAITTVKGAQFKTPLFEFSGACAGCGETPYVKLVTQLFGNRMVIANATGCSSIYGGTFPAIPYCTDDRGHGPAFGNSLFEDNAEYGFGMRLAVDANRKILKAAAEKVAASDCDSEFATAVRAQLEMWTSKEDAAIENQCKISDLLPAAIEAAPAECKETLQTISDLKDYFVDKSVWIFGGDGWAYDIGYGGVDHVVSQTKNVNILVMDTEVYSNTGGQASKATPIGAVAKFANGGMQLGKKLMPFMCMSYGHVYVAHVNMGANRMQLQKAMMEAEAWDGPSIVFAYSPCIAHGINMMTSQKEAKAATECGYWPLFRYNPALEEGKRFVFESKEPKGDFQAFIRGERRYTALQKTNPDQYEELLKASEDDAKRRWAFYQNLGNIL